MIKLIIDLLLKKGWMLLSNLFISMILFYYVGSEAWSIVVIFLSLNMLGLIFGVGIKSKTSLSDNDNDICINYYSMLIINFLTILGMFLFYYIKGIDNYLILFFSLILVILSNVNSFYQGFFLYSGEIKKSTDILMKANIFKLLAFMFLFFIYKKVYLFFILQFLEQVYIYARSVRKKPTINFDHKNIFSRLKELFYISIGSIPFIFVSSTLQIDIARSMSATSAGYFGLFVQLINSVRSIFIFIVTNFQKKMLSYRHYFKKILNFCIGSLVFLVGILLINLLGVVNINYEGYILVSLVNLTYLIVLLVANIQNIFKLNKISFNISLLFMFFLGIGWLVDCITIIGVAFWVTIYMISMLLRAFIVNSAFLKLNKD
ncbi:hypothetical protein [Acinetobacter haemolyticus]|uniref:hypothetical protein n=1 Tax=Acinetobacter haemolyticus TaxID=29430 RepID=UPI001331E161|nr:hypothetical protein [Acinetobacter haemolyticus]QHI18136.1 hypothetical protein AhaeAN4_16990 [Acinetobacter haemolyticus]